MTTVNPHGQTITYGKHKGELFTRLPRSYLTWLVNESAPQHEIAKAELERRGSKIPEVEVSIHAIDNASLRVLDIYRRDRGDDEGLYSWLERMTLEAVKQGKKIGDKLHYKGMKFAVAEGAEFPVLKTIMRNKAVSGEQEQTE